MPRKMLRWIHWTTLGAPAILSVLVVLADFLGKADLISEKSVGRLTLFLVSSTILNLFVALAPLDALRDIRSRLAGIDLEGAGAKQRRDRYAGVTKVHKMFPADVFEGYVRKAQQVTILNTWIPNLGVLESDLKDALLRGAEVRILMLQPESKLVGLRQAALKTAPRASGAAHVRSGVEECLQQLADLYHDLPDEQRCGLKVKLFDSQVSISVYHADEQFLVSMYMHGQLAIHTPQLEIEGTSDTVLGKQIDKELRKLWEIGEDVDLATLSAASEEQVVSP